MLTSHLFTVVYSCIPSKYGKYVTMKQDEFIGNLYKDFRIGQNHIYQVMLCKMLERDGKIKTIGLKEKGGWIS